MTQFRVAGPYSPTVRRLPDGSLQKSYAHCAWWYRSTVGRLAISRECWALERLSSSCHVPKLIQRSEPWTMECEFIEGQSLERLSRGEVDSAKLRREAQSLLRDLQQAGLAHGDMGHDFCQGMGRECNLIWSLDERLFAIDFAGSLPADSSYPILGALGRVLAKHDTLILDKIDCHFGPSGLDNESVALNWTTETWDLLRVLGKI